MIISAPPGSTVRLCNSRAMKSKFVSDGYKVKAVLQTLGGDWLMHLEVLEDLP